MPKTVLERLRGIDYKVAQRVNRKKIGNLVGRLYFTPQGGTRKEVPITGFVDNGSTSTSNGDIQGKAHSFTVKIDRDWYDKNRKLSGNYEIIQSGKKKDGYVNVDIESEVADDSLTYAQVTFMHEFGIETYSEETFA